MTLGTVTGTANQALRQPERYSNSFAGYNYTISNPNGFLGTFSQLHLRVW